MGQRGPLPATYGLPWRLRQALRSRPDLWWTTAMLRTWVGNGMRRTNINRALAVLVKNGYAEVVRHVDGNTHHPSEYRTLEGGKRERGRTDR